MTNRFHTLAAAPSARATCAAALLALSAATPHAAPTQLVGDHQVTGDLYVDFGLFVGGGALIDDTAILGETVCIGINCGNNPATEPFLNNFPVKLQGPTVGIEFYDTSSGTHPGRNWGLLVNDEAAYGSGGIDRFSVRDMDAGTTPFTIAAGAPDNALWVDSSGVVGIGTQFPSQPLHISHPTQATLRLDYTGGAGFLPRLWDIKNQNGLYFEDANTGDQPLRIYAGAGHNMVAITNAGGVGIGTNSVSGWLTVQTGGVPTGLVVQNSSFNSVPADAFAHFRNDLGTTQLLIEEANATTVPRTLLNLQNNGRPEIVMGNTATNGEWSFGAGTDFFLKVGTVGSTSGAKTKVFTVKNNGDAIVFGTLTTGGTTCGGGCDRVFTDRAVIPAETYAAQMWSQGHLPHVGPTVEGAPLNVSEKLGGLLNAVEHAHIFIDAQRIRDQEQQAEIARLKADKAAQDARIARLEARLAALVADR